jgi:hypothetical protein
MCGGGTISSTDFIQKVVLCYSICVPHVHMQGLSKVIKNAHMHVKTVQHKKKQIQMNKNQSDSDW